MWWPETDPLWCLITHPSLLLSRLDYALSGCKLLHTYHRHIEVLLLLSERSVSLHEGWTALALAFSDKILVRLSDVLAFDRVENRR